MGERVWGVPFYSILKYAGGVLVVQEVTAEHIPANVQVYYKIF